MAWRRNKRDDFSWQAGENLGCAINGAADDFTPAFFEDDATGDGWLYFSSNRPGLGGTDIYVSAIGNDGAFGPASLVAELSTSFLDQRPNIRRDGLEIFFDSNRPGALGSTDLYVSTRASLADPWSPPVNLGPLVNSASLEGRPGLSFDGTTLYFMSNRPGGSGGIDLYFTARTKLTGPG